MSRPLIVLKCGCAISPLNPPLNPTSRYPCPNSLGHGYRVGWSRYDHNGRRFDNPKDTP